MEQRTIERLYQNFKKEVLAETDPKRLVLKAQDFGLFSWGYYPGVYTDTDVEKKLSTIMLPSVDMEVKPVEEHYVYIATRLFEVGGHSRCILHCIDNLKQAKHTVILTDQRKKLPVNLSSFFDQHHTKVIIPAASADPLRKAAMLRQEIIDLRPSRIFLFTHPNDLLPLIAFGKFHPCEIQLFNHADHTFWLRGDWIDTVIDFRETGLKVTREGRLMKRSALHRLPVSYSYEYMGRAAAKKDMGYSANEMIIGTLTNFAKVQSEAGQVSFVQVILDWTIAYPGCKFLIIGLSADQFSLLLHAKVELPPNLICLDIVPDPESYYKAFDFFVEPFPIASPLGILEACKYGSIPIFSPHTCQLAESYEAFHESIQKEFSKPADLNELEHNFREMINLPAEKINVLSEKVRELIYKHHRGEHWAAELKNIASRIGSNEDKASTADIYADMNYFREYVKKEDNNFFQELLSMKNIVTRKIMWSFFMGKYRIFHLHKLTIKSWKLLAWKTLRA